MKHAAGHESFCIGWDVGAWNCDKNGKSRDAIVILDSSLNLVGEPWRGNMRKCICAAAATRDWLAALFAHCQAEFPGLPTSVTMAIDTPLGFPEQFVALATGRSWGEPDADSGNNHYLFRHTERHLFAQGLRPLSAIKDMIGSQATKGMHALAKFAPRSEGCGVWTDGAGFRAIETYPTACRNTTAVKSLLKGRKPLGHDDKDDARICALVAHLFATERGSLAAPPEQVPKREGWIWVPREVIKTRSS